MSIVTMILGESGTGKSASLRNMYPADTLLIQAIRKQLPFKSGDWTEISKDGGNIIVSDKSAAIASAISKTSRPIVVIDDFQYIMANEFMRRVLDNETGNSAFAKYNEIARYVWDIINAANSSNKRVYILSHTQTDESGKTKIKTIGKLLDEKIVLEGMVTIVLRTHVDGRDYLLRTVNNGNDTVKAPMGMFDADMITNDLQEIDEAICAYYILENNNA